MFSGQVEGRVSKKFQIAFPAVFRREIGERIILTKSLDMCLLLIGEEKWETLLEGTKGMPFTDKATRELQRYLFGNASTIQLDMQGRFLIPEYLRDYAAVQQDIVFVGVHRYVELWDKQRWKDHQKSIAGSIDLLTVNLSESNGHE